MTSDATHGRCLPNPIEEPDHWLTTLAEAITDIAWGVANIVWFDPANERETSAYLDSTPPDERGRTDFLRRFEIRFPHGKTGQDRRDTQRWQKMLASRHMTGQEYLEGTALELAECWPVTIHRTTDLLKEIIAQKEEVFASPVIAPAQDIVHEVLACLVTISEEGLALIERWKETLAIDGFSDEDTVEELFDDAAAFAEHLRKHNLQTDLDKLANRIRAHGLMQPKTEVDRVLQVVYADGESKPCMHSDDYSSVTWYGQDYQFGATQALCVKLLWAEWEKDATAELGLREKTIGEEIGSANANYRLRHTFRRRDGQMHPAWGRMIHSRGDGSFYLARPQASTRRKVQKKRMAKKRPAKK